MSFTATSPPVVADEPEIENAPFFPSIDPEDIRAAQRIDGTITAERLAECLMEAMASVNKELSSWKSTQIAAGHATLSDVPADQIGGTSIHVRRYLRAVGCFTKANLVERYRDFDTTARGDRKADVLDNPIDDLRRDGRWAISDILGVSRTVVELI
jgi:hypothetical protein